MICNDETVICNPFHDLVNLIVDGCLKQPPKREERARDVACCSESKTELVPLKERAAAMVVVLRWLCWVAVLTGRQWLEIDGGKRSDTMDRSSRLLWREKLCSSEIKKDSGGAVGLLFKGRRKWKSQVSEDAYQKTEQPVEPSVAETDMVDEAVSTIVIHRNLSE
ncbi:hypothetical protein L2E82_17588 [Cichorium intybus]|uniref:Uncharacterized protein n=1 Tax=Cichorium intybus TaxID=13427 RepID=A0ACB9F8L8_CICIN|nr:hypothetical protein L2E82_17588 [Cichorium intybus]